MTTTTQTTIDQTELAKFSHHATAWWDVHGPLKTLHDINPVRVEFIRAHQALSGARLLDVGCGGGILSEALAKSGACVTGIDAEETAIAAAREHAIESQLSIEYACTPIESWQAESYDCITCLELLEHVTHPERVIEHAQRLLKSGGLFFLSTINRTLRAYATAIVGAEYVLSLLPRQTHDFDKFIKPSELVALLRQQGFELIALSGMAYNPFTRVASLCESVDVNYVLAARRI